MQDLAWSEAAAAMGAPREEIYFVNPTAPVAMFRPVITVTVQQLVGDNQLSQLTAEVELATEAGAVDDGGQSEPRSPGPALRDTTVQYAVVKIGAAFGFDASDARQQVKLRVGGPKGPTLRTNDQGRSFRSVGIRAGVLIVVKVMLKDRPPKWALGGNRLSTHDILAGAGSSAAPLATGAPAAPTSESAA